MSNPTSNFGWQMPEPTDLVTDLPADFEVFGQAVDTDFVDLLGGTTGQILSKTSATDLDFTWVSPNAGDITGVTAGTGISGGGTSGDVTITNSMATEITAKADLIVGTGNAAFDNLPVGTNGHVLTADSTVSPTGLKWAAPAGGGKVLQVVEGSYATQVDNSTTTFADTGLTATITPSSASSKILVIVKQAASKNNLNVDNAPIVGLFRNSTKIDDIVGFYSATALTMYGTLSLMKLDAPSTTSAVTYKTQFKNNTAASAANVQAGSYPSIIILMEIGA
jgi:hypothetical protein